MADGNREAQPAYEDLLREVAHLRDEVEDLRDEIDRLHEVGETTLTAHWRLDLERMTLEVGPAWSRLLGWSAEEIGSDLGSIRDTLIWAEDRAAFEREIARHVAGETDRYEVEIRLRRKDGGFVWVRDRGRITRRNHAGAPLAMAGAWIDVSERKVAELARHAAEEAAYLAGRRFQEAIDALPHGFLLFDPQDRLVACNETIKRMFPLCAERLDIGVDYGELLRHMLGDGEYGCPPADGERMANRILAARAAGDTDWELDLSDGRIVRAFDRRLRDGWRVGIRVDVTALRSAERRAAEAVETRDRLVTALDALPDGMMIFDAADRIVHYNRRTEEMYPWIAELPKGAAAYADLLRGSIARGAFAAVPGREEACLAEYLAERARHSSFQRDVRRPDGRWLRIVDQTTPDGGRIGLRVDVTELRHRADQLETIIEASGLATVEYDFVADRAVHNARWAAMLGYPDDVPIAPTFATLLALAHPDDRASLEAALDGPNEGEAPRVYPDFRVRKADGAYLWVQMRGRVVERGPSGEPLRASAVVVDVSAAKAVEAALSAASEAKSRFLATITHEIRTPLQGVLGMAELLEPTLVEPEQKRMLATMRESGALLHAIVDDVLDLAKIGAGQLRLDAVAYRPAELALQVVAAHRPQAAAKGLTLTATAERGAERPRLGDPQRLLQILHNLVGNAVKFTDSGGVAVSVSVGADHLVIEVRDSGVGMTAAQLARVFEPFSQADRSTARKYGGTGLGMSIVRGLVTSMQGEIDVDSRPGGGTRVRVLVPTQAWTPDAGEADTPQPHHSARSLHVLVVDDNATNRMVLEGLLRALGHRPEAAENGAEALSRLAAERYDLVLLDVEMPDLDGYATLAAIRTAELTVSRPRVPIVAVTARALGGDAAHFEAAGFDGYLAKPVTRDKLHACVWPFCGPQSNSA